MQIQDGLHQANKSILSKFMGKQESEEQELRDKLDILHAFTDEELDDYTCLTSRAKLDISRVTGCAPADINKMLMHFQVFSRMHAWLHRTRDAGEPIPKSSEELFERYKSSPINITENFKGRNRKIKLSKKQADIYYKYGERALRL